MTNFSSQLELPTRWKVGWPTFYHGLNFQSWWNVAHYPVFHHDLTLWWNVVHFLLRPRLARITICDGILLKSVVIDFFIVVFWGLSSSLVPIGCCLVVWEVMEFSFFFPLFFFCVSLVASNCFSLLCWLLLCWPITAWFHQYLVDILFLPLKNKQIVVITESI